MGRQVGTPKRSWLVTAVALGLLLIGGTAAGAYLWTHGHPETIVLVAVAFFTVDAVVLRR